MAALAAMEAKMIRKIIQIDQDKCNGCGLCVEACHEGAIGMVNGKAQLLRDDYCDGLGDCLPACPTEAITFVEREAAEYDKAASEANIKKKKQSTHKESDCKPESEIQNWPLQIKLVPIRAPYFDGANLLIAADCSAFAYGDFHNRFMKNRITLIGCPKLDQSDYSEKLTEIIKENDINSVTVTRMGVPCCGGIVHAVKIALQSSGKMIPWQVVTITTDGELQADNT